MIKVCTKNTLNPKPYYHGCAPRLLIIWRPMQRNGSSISVCTTVERIIISGWLWISTSLTNTKSLKKVCAHTHIFTMYIYMYAYQTHTCIYTCIYIWLCYVLWQMSTNSSSKAFFQTHQPTHTHTYICIYINKNHIQHTYIT